MRTGRCGPQRQGRPSAGSHALAAPRMLSLPSGIGYGRVPRLSVAVLRNRNISEATSLG
jgi:hypothetical protein